MNQVKGQREKGKGMKGSSLLKIALLTFALLPCTFSLALAGSPGTTSVNFLGMETGARQSGMGGGGAALGDDINADRHNPAGLATLQTLETSFLFSSYFQDINYGYAAGAVPTTFGTLGLQATQLNYGTFSGYSPNNTYTGSLNAGDTAVGLSYARELLAGLSAGGTFRYIREKLDTVTASGESFDAGLLYRTQGYDPILSKLSFGATVENIGPTIRYIQQSASLPRQIVFGAALNQWEGLTAYMEVHAPNDALSYETLGAEYWWQNRFALRTGYQTGRDIGPGISVGAGARFGAFQIDYAWVPFGDLGDVNQIGIIYRFGHVIQPKRNIIKYHPRSELKLEGAWMEGAPDDLFVTSAPVVQVSSPATAVPPALGPMTAFIGEQSADLDKAVKDLTKNPIQFGASDKEILPTYCSVLDEVVWALQKDPQLRAQVFGYSDNTGSAEENRTLSLERAQSVQRYLVKTGQIAPERIAVVGMGSDLPVASNQTPEGRRANRRTEIQLVK